MHNGRLGSNYGLVGALNQVFPGLSENLNGDILGNQVLINKGSHKVKIRLRGRGKAHLDFFVTHPHQQLKHDAFALRAHRINQRLVAIAQIHRTPARCLGDGGSRPRAIGKIHTERLAIGPVLMYRHR